jgi:uncharacterized protein (DUF2236 family)
MLNIMNEFGLEQPDLRNQFNPECSLPEGFPLPEDSVLRRITGEPIGAFLLQRAVLLEVAHPIVAEGVKNHSAVKEHPVSRLLSVYTMALKLIRSQDEQEAMEAATSIYNLHNHIQGHGYSAQMAEAQMWVVGTLVDLAETVPKYVGRLEDGESESMYQDIVTFTKFFGIPQEIVPQDREAFQEYYDDIWDKGILGKTVSSREMMDMVLNFKHWQVPSPIVSQLRALTLHSLSSYEREALDLYPSESEERRGQRLDSLLQATYRHTPEFRRRMPDMYLKIRNSRLGDAILGRLETHPIN